MTSAATEPPSTTPPRWPHCGHGAHPETDPVGCRGIQIPGHTSCLAHADQAAQDDYLTALRPGTHLDHSGTPFTEALLRRLLHALTDPNTRRPHVSYALFSGATFGNHANFYRATFGERADFYSAAFGDHANFDGATFVNHANLGEATFGNHAHFDSVTFGNRASFGRTTFGNHAHFDGATFGDHANLGEATFGNHAHFDSVTFGDHANLGSVTFGNHANFYRATFGERARFALAAFGNHALFTGATFGDVDLTRVAFGRDARLKGVAFGQTAVVGPLVCAGELDLSGAVFETAVTMEAAAATLCCRRTRWASTAALRLRHAAVDLSDAVMEFPVSVATHTRPFTDGNGAEVAEPALTHRPVQVLSLRGVDAAHLVLTDVDLTDCRFAGTIHLDQLRLEGRCPLPTPPSEQRRWRLVRRWTPRRTLPEEQHWRAARPSGARGWTPAPAGEVVLGPAALAPTYRQLRKAFEDGKNEPGAADFYYGEMEMRRHDEDTPRAERALLAAYWAVSGYGLRASRAIAWLLVALAATVTVMVLWGLPQETPKPTTTGRQAGPGQSVTLVTDTPDPVKPDGPLADRVTGERFGKAVHVTLESGLFRSSGKDLTTVGTGAELTFRFTAPILLALAVLAIRGRVKR